MEGIPTTNNAEIEKEDTVETKEGIKNIIDCDADPFVHEGWTVDEHQKGGQFEWDPANIELYLTDAQKEKEGRIDGNELRKELVGKSVLNANVLDYLLKHPELIPEKWESNFVFFWGTIYRDQNGQPHVRYLRHMPRFKVPFIWDDRRLGHDHFDDDPAAVLRKD